MPMLTVRITDAADEVAPLEIETIRAAIRHALAHLDAPANVHLNRADGRWAVKSASVKLPRSGVVLNVEPQVRVALAVIGVLQAGGELLSP
jgi:hypothetical protein